MKLPTGLGLMVMGVVGVARGAAGQSARQAALAAHPPHVAALVGAFLFVGGLMLVARKDAFNGRGSIRSNAGGPANTSSGAK